MSGLGEMLVPFLGNVPTAMDVSMYLYLTNILIFAVLLRFVFGFIHALISMFNKS